MRRALMAALLACGSTGLLAVQITQTGTQGKDLALLPAGTQLGQDAYELPREVFRSQQHGGHRSELAILGDVAFSSPALLGPVARQAGISCASCHVQGASNPRLFIPGLSSRPGTFDTTNHLFNPAADDGVLNPLTIPSLRGAHLLAPYGHDGRTPSLRDFVRNVIVREFGGEQPSARMLDALVAYIEDIDFVPNPRLQAEGNLGAGNSAAARRGERLFRRPFRHDPTLSCAACHPPGQAFMDHRQHEVGSGGRFKTPTLRNANFNAPYFHDGRFDTYEQVVAHFDRVFVLRLSARERADLVAYLQAVGDGTEALQPDSIALRMQELEDCGHALQIAIGQREPAAARLIADTLDREWRELTEKFPDRRDSTVSGGQVARMRARALLRQQVLTLRGVQLALEDGRFEEASQSLRVYRDRIAASVAAMRAAAPWSLFDRKVQQAHFAALHELNRAAGENATLLP